MAKYFKEGDIIISKIKNKVGKITKITTKNFMNAQWGELTIKWLDKTETTCMDDLVDHIDDVIKDLIDKLDVLEDKKEKSKLL